MNKGTMRVLVTGGTGLVGKALEQVLAEDQSDNQSAGEWFFVGTKEADLT